MSARSSAAVQDVANDAVQSQDDHRLALKPSTGRATQVHGRRGNPNDRRRAATTQTFSQKRFAPAAQSIHLAASAFPALVLNADFQPLSWYPLSVWCWQDTIRAMFLDRVSVLSHYDRLIRSPGRELRLPSVVALKQYVPQERRPPFTRFNLFLRDRFTCQYCNTTAPTQDLTFDHVVPRSRGGRTSWDNIATACTRCNLKKGSRLPHECGMHPANKPHQPSPYQLRLNGRAFPPNYLHQSWRDFLYWDSELEA